MTPRKPRPTTLPTIPESSALTLPSNTDTTTPPNTGSAWDTSSSSSSSETDASNSKSLIPRPTNPTARSITSDPDPDIETIPTTPTHPWPEVHTPPPTLLTLESHLKSSIQRAGPIGPLLTRMERDMLIMEMMQAFGEAETAMKMAVAMGEPEGGKERAVERTVRGMEIAGELGDREFLERGEYLLAWVAGVGSRSGSASGAVDGGEDGGRRKRRRVEKTGSREKSKKKAKGKESGKERGKGKKGKDKKKKKGKAVERRASPPSASSGAGSLRLTSPVTDPGTGDLLGDYFEGVDEYENAGAGGRWEMLSQGSEVGNGQNVAYDGDDDSSGSEDAGKEEEDTRDQDQDDIQEGKGEDESFRPHAPIPPHSPSPSRSSTEVTSSEDSAHEQLQSDSSDTHSDDLQLQVVPEHSLPPASPEQPEVSPRYSASPSVSTAESDTSYEADPESSSSDESTLSRTIIRKRNRSPISNRNLAYTYLHKPGRKSKSKCKQIAKFTANTPSPNPTPNRNRRKLSFTPKIWHHHDQNADIDDPFPSFFWDTRIGSVLIADEVQNWDMDWLPKSKSYPIRQAEFTFRAAVPMREMASRVRPTRIFPEQQWEFIARRRDWGEFLRGTAGQKVSMRFLEWERGRMEMLVREKREIGKLNLHSQSLLDSLDMFVDFDFDLQNSTEGQAAFAICVVFCIAYVFFLPVVKILLRTLVI
ncbi:hypothetical protein BJX61DRAFT_546901 [Aspergillus egyptiacus]|nr:hypothetical protein BJX61DRAFT_546901 [Aspergillus egyptiacus]